MNTIHNSCGLCRIELKNLFVRDGNDILLENINLDFHCGELTALIGRNGAGKTTLLKALLGERNYSGEIHYERHDHTQSGRPITGYVPQHLLFDKSTPVSVLDFMLLGKSKRPVWLKHTKAEKEKVQKQLEAMECSHIMNRTLGDLSGGELQRVLLAAAIDPIPDLLILDEPVSGMDITGLELFYKTVSSLRDQHHLAILLVSHDLSLIKKYADKAILLDKTIVAQGTVEEVFQTPEFLSIFGFLADTDKVSNTIGRNLKI